MRKGKLIGQRCWAWAKSKAPLPHLCPVSGEIQLHPLELLCPDSLGDSGQFICKCGKAWGNFRGWEGIPELWEDSALPANSSMVNARYHHTLCQSLALQCLLGLLESTRKQVEQSASFSLRCSVGPCWKFQDFPYQRQSQLSEQREKWVAFLFNSTLKCGGESCGKLQDSQIASLGMSLVRKD